MKMKFYKSLMIENLKIILLTYKKGCQELIFQQVLYKQ